MKAKIKWKDLIPEIDAALSFFVEEGVKPSLRTLFYRLVSKQLIPNTRSAYKRLSRLLVEERKRGRFEWDILEDRTRYTLGSFDSSHPSEDDLLRSKRWLEDELEALDLRQILEQKFKWLLPSIRVGYWAGQPNYVELWVEKDALAQTLHNWTDGLVPVRVMRGYSSWTYIYNSLKEISERAQDRKVFILYIGDLDPSGVDIQRFLMESVGYFGAKLEFHRIAVTPRQVETYNLPQRPEDSETLAKLQRDPRSRGYILDYVVEVDALLAFVPSEFRRLVNLEIQKLHNKRIYEQMKKQAEKIEKQAKELLETFIQQGFEKIKKEVLAE